jgi:hypothetical protein
MASRKVQTQLEMQIVSSLTNPSAGFVGLSAKSDGIYQKIPSGSDEKLLTAVPDASVSYAKVAAALTQKNTVTSSVDLSANGIGAITLSANTAFTFSGFQLNRSYLLVITANGFTPSWAVGARHIPVTGNESFGTTGVFYVNLTCIDATSGSEKLLTMIMKGA